MSKQLNIVLRERLKAEALENTGRDWRLRATWFPLEEEARKKDEASAQ